MAVVVVVVVPRLVSTHTKKEESNSSILDALTRRGKKTCSNGSNCDALTNYTTHTNHILLASLAEHASNSMVYSCNPKETMHNRQSMLIPF
jgi:hypothetical protein